MAVTLGDAVFYLRANESELISKLQAAEAKARDFATKMQQAFDGVGKGTGNAAGGIDKVKTGLQNVAAQAATTEGALQKVVNGALSKIGGLAVEGLGKLVSLSKDAGVAIIKTAADYETTMNVLQDATGATNAQMVQVSKTAKALGADLELPNTSASGAAKAITELAKGGLSLDQAMKAAKGTLQLATVGMMDEAKAAEITSGAINMFKLSGEDAAKVTNLLAAAANSSSGDVKDFADAMRMGGSVAAMAKIPIEDFTTATALMAQQGIKGSDAGTSLKTMFLSLQSPTDKAKALMDSYGISVYDTSGKMKPLPDIMKQFSAALSDNATQLVVTGGATKKQANEASKAAESQEKLTAAIGFGNRQLEIAQRELAAMTSNAKTSKTAIDNKKLSIDKLKNSLAEKNDKLADANGKIDAYAKAAGTTRTAILQMTQEQRNQTLATIFGTDAVRAANAVLMSGEDAWNEMSTAVTKAGAAAGAAEAQTKGLAGAWKGLKSQLETVALTLGEPLLKPLAAAVNGISSLIGNAGVKIETYIAGFISNFNSFSDPLEALRQNLKMVFSPSLWGAIDTAVNIFKSIRDAIDKTSSYIAGFVNNFKSFSDPLEAFRQNLKMIFDPSLWGGVDVVVNSVKQLREKINQFFVDFSIGARAFRDPLEAARLALMGFFGSENSAKINALIDSLKNFRGFIETLPAKIAPFAAIAEKLFKQVLPIALAESSGKFDTLKTAIETAIKLAGDVITAFEPVVVGVFGAVSAFLDKNGADIVTTLGSAWDKVSGIIKGVAEIVSIVVKLYFGQIALFIKLNGAEIEVFLSTLWNAIKILITGSLNIINGVVKTALDLLKGNWKGAWDDVKQIFSVIVLAISDLVILFLGNLAQAISNFRQVGSKIWHDALDEFEFIIRKGLIRAKTLVNQILDDILGVVKGFVGQFSDAGANMIEGFIGGIKSKAGALLDAARSVISGAIGIVRRTLDERSPSRVLFASGGNAIQGFINGVLNKSGPLNDAMKSTVASATNVLIGEGASWGEVSKAITASLGEIRKSAKVEFDATHQITKTTTKAQRAQIAAEWDAIAADLKVKEEGIRAAAKTTWDGMKADQKTATEGIKGDQKDIWGDISDLIGEFTDEIRKTTLQEGFEEIRDAGTKFTRELADDTSDVWRELSAAVNEKAKEMRDAVKGASAEQKAAVEADIRAMRADVQDKWREMGRDVRDASKEVRDRVAEAYKEMREDVADKLDIIKKTAQREWDAAKDAATKAIAEAKKNNITDFTAIEAALKAKGEAIYDNAQKAYSNLRDDSKRKLDEFKRNNQGAWDDVKKITVDTVKTIVDDVLGGFSKIEKDGGSAVNRFVNGVKTGMSAVSESAQEAAEAVKTETQNIVNAIIPVMTTLQEFWQYVPGGIGGMDGRPSTQAQSWTDSFINQPSAPPTTTPIVRPTPQPSAPPTTTPPSTAWTFDPLIGMWVDGKGNTRPYEDNPNQPRAIKPPTGSGPRVGRPEFARGGIASGPAGGYAATLHGTEAVVPLPNGRTIPVEIRGGGDNSAPVVRAIEAMTIVLERAIKNNGRGNSVTINNRTGFDVGEIMRSGQSTRGN